MRRLSPWVLILLLPALFGSLAGELLHLADHDDHSESHVLARAEPSDRHGDCDAWQAEKERHSSHQELQFEPVSALLHGDHAALCPVCGHSLSAVASDVEMFGSSDSRVLAGLPHGPPTCDTSYGFPRPRAPPLA